MLISTSTKSPVAHSNSKFVWIFEAIFLCWIINLTALAEPLATAEENVKPPDNHVSVEKKENVKLETTTDGVSKEAIQPLTKRQLKSIERLIKSKKIKLNSPIKVFRIGGVEVHQLYNDKFVWTKKAYNDALDSSGVSGRQSLVHLPKSKLRFLDRDTKEFIAELRFNGLANDCEETYTLSNIDAKTPWPEMLYSCPSFYRGAMKHIAFISVSNEKGVLINSELYGNEDKIEVEGKIEVLPVQVKKEFPGELYEVGDFISRDTGRKLRLPRDSSVPSFYLVPLAPVLGIWQCSACMITIYSALMLENGKWIDANSEAGSQKFFDKSLRELEKDYSSYKKSKEPSNFAMNEFLFAKLAYSIRLGRGPKAWKSVSKLFEPSRFEPCAGKDSCRMDSSGANQQLSDDPCGKKFKCPFKDWQSEIRFELESRGISSEGLK